MFLYVFARWLARLFVAVHPARPRRAGDLTEVAAGSPQHTPTQRATRERRLARA
jgi:hypothetical protein